MGLLHKLKKHLPYTHYHILKAYLQDRYLFVKYQDYSSSLHRINSGVPQGNMLGPVLYSLYTADLPTTSLVMTATFADDTAIRASQNLQRNLNDVQRRLKKRRINANGTKSSYVTFTMRNYTSMPTSNTQRLTTATKLRRKICWYVFGQASYTAKTCNY